MTAGSRVDSDAMDLLGFSDIDFGNDDEDEEKQDEEWLDGENVALHQVAEVTSSFDWLRRKSNLSLEDCDFWRHKEVRIIEKDYKETECKVQFIDSDNEVHETWLPTKVLVSLEVDWGVGLDPQVRIVPENYYFITNDEDLFRRCWQECGMEEMPIPISDYLGENVRVEEIDLDDKTADILLRGYKELCVPLAVLSDNSGRGEGGGAQGEGGFAGIFDDDDVQADYPVDNFYSVL